MKILIALCLVLALCYADTSGEFDLPVRKEELPGDNKAVEFLKGMIEGLGVKEDIEKFMKCIKEAEHVFAKIKEALEHLKHMNINELKKGLQLLFEALKEFFEMLKPCAESGSIIHKLISAITNANIAKIALHILMHPVQFVKDVSTSHPFSSLHFLLIELSLLLLLTFSSRLHPHHSRCFDSMLH